MNGPTPIAIAGAAACAVLAAAALLPRAGAWPLRLLVCVAAGLWLASTCEPSRDGQETLQPRTIVVASGPIPEPVAHALAESVGPALRLVEASPDRGALALALREARAAGDAAALLWVAPIDGDGAPAARVPDVAVLAAPAPLGFAPNDVRVTVVGEQRAGRPLRLEASGLPAGWEGELRVEGPPGGTAPLAGRGEVDAALDVLPRAAGALPVHLQAGSGGATFTAAGVLPIEPPPAWQVVGPGAEVLAGALEAQGFGAATSPTLVDADLGAVEGVIVTHVLSEDEQQRLRDFVAAGGGVFLVGRPDGGALPIAGEPAADLSPVVLPSRPAVPGAPSPGEGEGAAQPPEDAGEPPPAAPPPPAEPEPARGATGDARPPTGPKSVVQRRSVAMVFLIDRSESMLAEATPGGPTRMDYVRASAQATASRLLAGDELAVVTFGSPDEEAVVLPLTPVTQFERIHGALAGLQARRNEGTYVESALVRAALVLAGSPAAVKHVVLITDGQIADLIRASTPARELAAAGATVSMVRLGSEPDLRDSDLCRRFVALGGGHYLSSTSTTEIPALVSAEVKRVLSASGRPLADAAPAEGAGQEGSPPPAEPPARDTPPPTAEPAPPQPVPAVRLAVRAVDSSPLLEPTPEGGLPSLGGMLEVAARPEARVLLVAGDEGRPVLAFKNHGLGRVAAWTADLAGPWSADWRAEPAFPAWVAQWVAAVLPARATSAPADVLTVRSVEPRGPTPDEVEALQTWAGAPLRSLDSLAAPPPRAVPVERPLTGLLALAGALVLLLLAAGEWLAGRVR